MRLFVSFDLPMTTKDDIKIYTSFRKTLLQEGFIMMQYSTYIRFCRNDSEYLKFVRRIKAIAPREHGSIRIYALTEKQYQKMHVLSSRKKSDEELLSIHPLVVIE